MKDIRFGLVTLAAVLLAVCLPARANATTFTLDCFYASATVSLGSCQPLSPNQGTITYNDTTGAGTIDLTDAANGAKVFDLYLALGPGTYNPALFSLTGADVKNLVVNIDGVQAGGYSAGKFDLDLGFLASLHEPYAFTLLYNGAPVDLSGTSTDGQLRAAAHVGGFALGCSEWLGDSTSGTGATVNSDLCGGDGSPLTVSEPASMLLFGLGATGIAARMRRRARL